MRIISGSHKGRAIKPPSGLEVRPTTDYAKEALFNILDARFCLDEVEALDLFAGTGSISYEFASRGCIRVVTIEQNANCIKYILDTVREMNFDSIEVYRRDVFKSLDMVKGPFDVIFADPPYHLKTIASIPELVLHKNLLKPEGLFIMEHGSEVNFNHIPGFIEKRVYSRVHFSFFTRWET